MGLPSIILKDVFLLLLRLPSTLAKLFRPGGSRTVIAENLLLKQQLIIHSRSRQRAPNLTNRDRVLLGVWSLFLNPRRIAKSAIAIKPSTPLRFHSALRKRKYRQLYSPGRGRKPGLRGPSKEIICAIIDMKQRNPHYNEHRCHTTRDGETPSETGGNKVVDISSHRWQKHRRGIFQLPTAA